MSPQPDPEALDDFDLAAFDALVAADEHREHNGHRTGDLDGHRTGDLGGYLTGRLERSTAERRWAAIVADGAVEGSPMNGVDGRHYTDLGNADRLIHAHGQHLRFVPRWGRWLVYDGGRWRLDHADTIASHLAGQLGRALLGRLEDVYDNAKKTGDLIHWVRRSESAAGIAATLTVAASRPGVAIDHESLDADPWAFNVRNGTINLLTGELRAHSPTDLLTMQAAVSFEANADAPAWRRFLGQVLVDPDVCRFVQRLAGLALLGDQPEHLLPILLGVGANGKSTLTKVVAAILGDYAVVACRDILLALKHETHPTARADLFRRRFAHSGELPPAAKLDEAQVKELTGGDRIKARRMREDFWEFNPSHLLWLHANHRPTIEGTDDGIWRRVVLVPFNVQIPAEDRDPRLAERIIAGEAPGVLAWMLDGLADYLENGLRIPDAVTVATERYRNESDTVAAFIVESGLIFDPREWISANDLLALHGEWFTASGPAETEKAHYQRVVAVLKDRGIVQRKNAQRGGRFWVGIGAPVMASDQGGDGL